MAMRLRLTCATRSTGTHKRMHNGHQVFPFAPLTPQGELLHVLPPATVQAWITSTFRSWERPYFFFLNNSEKICGNNNNKKQIKTKTGKKILKNVLNPVV